MKNNFDQLDPEIYAKNAIVAREAGLQLCSRLNLMALQPKLILDVGCGIGRESFLLKKYYPSACILAIDNAFSFLYAGYQKDKQEEIQKIHWVCADGYYLPLKEYTVDFIFANFLIPWCTDLVLVLNEWRRILKPNGLLLFSALGPDTLRECKIAELEKPFLIDMHHIGDALIQAGFLDPVLDNEYLTLTYQTETQCVEELKTTGMLPLDHVNLTPFSDLSLTYEIIYGHAWGGMIDSYRPDKQGNISIPVSSIPIKPHFPKS